MASTVSTPDRLSGPCHVGRPLCDAGQWALPVGLAPWPRLRRAVRLFACAQLALLLTWVGAWAWAAVQAQGSWGRAACALLISGVWAHVVWPGRMVRRQHAAHPSHPSFVLLWDDQGWGVPAWADEGVSSACAGQAPPRAPVSVQVMLAWGVWLAIRVRQQVPAGRPGKGRQVWVLLHQGRHLSCEDGHRLRALLWSQPVTWGNKMFGREEITPQVASWRHMFTQWTPRSSQDALSSVAASFSSARPSSWGGARPRRRHVAHSARDFASTWATTDHARDAGDECPGSSSGRVS